MSHLLDAIAGVPNACEPIPGIVTGGQPASEHLAALKRAGCEVVIDIREAMEPRPFKTPAAVVQAGLEYRSIPVGRSEERRVGKECRAGRGQCQQTNNVEA